MGTREEIVLFCSEFDHQVDEIKTIYRLLEEKVAKAKTESVSQELVESIGYWLHNLYSAYEDLFKLVASFWENSIHNHSRYHRELLTRMRLDIPEVRPALIRQEKSFKNLDELRGFRHVFRHAYSYGLDDERVFFLVERVFKAKDDILADIGRFRLEMDKMIQSSPE